MYRKLFATTALSLLLAGGAYAQDLPLDPAPPADDPGVVDQQPPAVELVSPSEIGINADGWLATEILGTSIFTSAGEEGESIGNVNDFVLDSEGGIAAVVVGVGGFLGLGEKNVALAWDELELTLDSDGNQRLVSNVTREQLDTAADFDRAAWLASESGAAAVGEPLNDEPIGAPAPLDEPAPMDEPLVDEPAPADDPFVDDPAPADGAPLDEPAPMDEPLVDEPPMDEPAPADGAVIDEPAPAVVGEPDAALDQEAQIVSTDDISAEDLTGTTVYGLDGEQIGTIGDILLTQEGGVEAVIIDFGGFLGIGNKPVAIAYQNLEFYRDAGDNLELRTALTTADLEVAPEYDEDTYADAPNQQLVTLQ